MTPPRCQQWRQRGAPPMDHGVLGAILETEEGVAPVTIRPTTKAGPTLAAARRCRARAGAS